MRIFLERPEVFRKFRSVVFKFRVVGTKRGGDADEEILGVRVEDGFEGFYDRGEEILHIPAPAYVRDGDGMVRGVEEEHPLAICMSYGKGDLFFGGEERIGLMSFVEIGLRDVNHIGAMLLVGKDDLVGIESTAN